MRRISGLDALIGRFRHRWQTDRQYRAAMSGIIGLVVVVSMCGCMGIVSAMANGALTGGGFLAGSGGQQTGGGGAVQAIPSFPTPTLAPWSVPTTPGWSAVPDSQTPIPPTPTVPAPPTPTDQPQMCSNPCGYGTPSTWKYCTNRCDVVNVAALPPNTQVTITITYPSTPPQTIPGTLTTDGSGSGTFKFAGPHGNGTATILLVYNTQTINFTWQCSDGG